MTKANPVRTGRVTRSSKTAAVGSALSQRAKSVRITSGQRSSINKSAAGSALTQRSAAKGN